MSTSIQYNICIAFLHKICYWNSQYIFLQAFLHISTLYSNCNRKFIAEKVYESDIGYEKVIEVFINKNNSNWAAERMRRIDRLAADILQTKIITPFMRFMIHNNLSLFSAEKKQARVLSHRSSHWCGASFNRLLIFPPFNFRSLAFWTMTAWNEFNIVWLVKCQTRTRWQNDARKIWWTIKRIVYRLEFFARPLVNESEFALLCGKINF